MRAEGLTGRGVIDRFLMIDRFYWHSRESTNKSFWKFKTCRRESSYYKDYVCVSSFTDIRDLSNEYSSLYHMMAYMISQHF